MEIHSIDRSKRIVNIIASHEDGVFVGENTRDNPLKRAVSKVVELHLPSTNYFNDFEAGDTEPLANYLIPDEDVPGKYTFANRVFAWVGHGGFSVVVGGEGDTMVEYAPFVESAEPAEVL